MVSIDKRWELGMSGCRIVSNIIEFINAMAPIVLRSSMLEQTPCMHSFVTLYSIRHPVNHHQLHCSRYSLCHPQSNNTSELPQQQH
jgi:hypothetical protein